MLKNQNLTDMFPESVGQTTKEASFFLLWIVLSFLNACVISVIHDFAMIEVTHFFSSFK